MRKLIFTLLPLVWVICLSHAVAKSYSVPDIRVKAEARPDGEMLVEEQITYHFSGSFSFAYRDIPLKRGESVSDVVISEAGRPFIDTTGKQPGTFSVTKSGNNVRVTWYFGAKNEARTFKLEYKISGVIQRYSDVAVLYYKFIGDDWDRPIGNVAVRVYAPQGASISNVRAWAHGPLHGTVDIQADGVVHFGVQPLPARTFWEGRIVYPSAIFREMPEQDLAMRARIFEEESRWAEEANRRREAHQRYLEEQAVRRERQRALAGRLSPVGWILGLAGLAMWFVLFRRHGKPHDVKSRAVPGEIPSDHPPAIVSCLMFNRNVGASAIVATLLDLANRGYVEIEETTHEKKSWFGGLRKETDYRFVTGQKPISELEAYEKDLLDFLLNQAGTSSEFTLSGVKRTASKNRSKFRKWFMEWIKQVKEHGKAFGFYEPIAVGSVVLNMLVGIAILVGGIVLSVVTDTAAGVPAMVMGGIQAVLSVALQRHTPEGRRLVIAWRAFRSHLKNTSKALGPVSLSSGNWGRYLAAAILFGMHNKLLPRIEMVDESGHAVWPVWYHAALGSSSGDLSALADGFSSMVNTMSSTMSSASGTGGGASGGGGGGSGGGGGGAG
ncbi:MAG: DUF2207 domain-containing protein [Candidatus Latescibacteria bacterium]|nr:DUF2207 domain-containing protein [Candidatus Latescibacterota bacterium]NIO55296.1 DUF2207 domain-containing protein [Candidatus Latescibacterota bacterium]